MKYNLAAPKKKHKRIKGKTKLPFSHTSYDLFEKELHDIVPMLVPVLDRGGILVDFVVLCQQLASQKLPTSNIALLLCLERAKYQACQSTSRMHYRQSTLKFWKVLYRLFHGKALRLLSGPKNTGSIVRNEENRGFHDQDFGNANFAVPDLKVLQSTNNFIPKEISPGIILPAVDNAASRVGKEFVLAVVGKSGSKSEYSVWRHRSLGT